MHKKRYVFIGLAMLIVSAIGMTVFGATQPLPWQQLLGISMRAVKEQPGIVARVNGEDVTLGQLNFQIAFLTQQGRLSGTQHKVTAGEALQQINRSRAQVHAALKRGITISDAEVKAELNSTRQSFEELRATDPARYKEVLGEFLAGLGQTEEQYWTESRERIRELLLVTKLRRQVVTALPAEQHADAWEKFVANLVSSAQVEILRPEVFNGKQANPPPQ